MTIKVYRVKIEGFVVSQDFGGSGPELTPGGWPPDQILEAMGADIEVTETLVDTIEAQPPVSMDKLEIAIDILSSIDGNDNVDTAQEYICQYYNEASARAKPEGG